MLWLYMVDQNNQIIKTISKIHKISTYNNSNTDLYKGVYIYINKYQYSIIAF